MATTKKNKKTAPAQVAAVAPAPSDRPRRVSLRLSAKLLQTLHAEKQILTHAAMMPHGHGARHVVVFSIPCTACPQPAQLARNDWYGCCVLSAAGAMIAFAAGKSSVIATPAGFRRVARR